jgi:hypothetical protein
MRWGTLSRAFPEGEVDDTPDNIYGGCIHAGTADYMTVPLCALVIQEVMFWN